MLAQNFEQRGFIENQTLFYPQTAPNDSGNIVDQILLRWDASYQLAPWLKFSGAIDARADSHEQTERIWNLDVDDRSIRRPALSLRRASATMHKGKFTAELGRQFIRWGKADILNPTDRFAPKDYLSSVVSSDFLGVVAARVTYESGSNTIDIVWQPLVHAEPHTSAQSTLDRASERSARHPDHRRRRPLSRRFAVRRAFQPRRRRL